MFSLWYLLRYSKNTYSSEEYCNFTFRGPSIVIYSYNTSQQNELFLAISLLRYKCVYIYISTTFNHNWN